MNGSQETNIKPPEWWKLQKFGKLRILEPTELNIFSHTKKDFICECGKAKSIRVKDVTSGKTSTCGRCAVMPIEWWTTQKFGNLRIRNPKLLNSSSKEQRVFTCDCGKEKSICVYDVVNGKTISCGQCNERDAKWWTTHKFGRLTLRNPEALNIYSKNKKLFSCICGTNKYISVRSVTSGRSKSCGQCAATIRAWYEENKEVIRALKAPIEPKDFLPGGPIPLDTITHNSRGFRALCPICRNIFMPSVTRLKSGHGLTCGCSTNQTSAPCYEISDFLAKAGFTIELEYKLSGYKYDVFIKESKLLVEFNGHLYHSDGKTKKRDEKKRFIAEAHGFKIITIDDRNWFKNKKLVLSEILGTATTYKYVGYSYKTRSELLAKIEELDILMKMNDIPIGMLSTLQERKELLLIDMKSAYEDIMSASISSHHVICDIKDMKPDEAYGNDPFIYYALGLAGESGELTGALLRAIRNGNSVQDKKAAVESELADCIIYAVILAYSTGIDLVKIVNDKARIVETRARAGYYGRSPRQ